MSVTAQQQEAFDIATALYCGLRLVKMIRQYAPTIPPIFQASTITSLRTEGVKLVNETDTAAQHLEKYLADLTIQLTTANPLIGQYIGQIANTLEDPNTSPKQKMEFVNR